MVKGKCWKVHCRKRMLVATLFDTEDLLNTALDFLKKTTDTKKINNGKLQKLLK
jgi:hypothetical protein